MSCSRRSYEDARALPGGRAGAAQASGGPARHHRHPIGQEERLVHVVVHHQRRLLVARPQLKEHFLQLHPRRGIEHPERLVEEEHLRQQGEGSRDADPLPHPARQLGRK